MYQATAGRKIETMYVGKKNKVVHQIFQTRKWQKASTDRSGAKSNTNTTTYIGNNKV